MNKRKPSNRPDGIIVIAIYQFLAATFWFSLVVIMVVFAIVPIGMFLDDIALYFSMSALIMITAIFFLFGIVNLWSGIGLWRLKNWARWTVLALSLVRLTGFPVLTIVGGLTMAYLLSHQAQTDFEPTAAEVDELTDMEVPMEADAVEEV